MRAALARPGYRIAPLHFGSNTDPDQPTERGLGLTRGRLKALLEHRLRISIVNKRALILRVLVLLTILATEQRVLVEISATTLDNRLAARMEPRTTTPHQRLEASDALVAGIPVGVFAVPIVPALPDQELEAVLSQAAAGRAAFARGTVIRRPHKLGARFPERAAQVMSLIQQTRNAGAIAALLALRCPLACHCLVLRPREAIALDTRRFRPPAGRQLSLPLG